MTRINGFNHNRPAELRIPAPGRLPNIDTVRAVVEQCLAMDDKKALETSTGYVQQGLRTTVSYVPQSLDTEESFRKALDSYTERLASYLQKNARRVSKESAAAELLIGSFALTADDPGRPAIWRGVGLWVPAIPLEPTA